MLKGQLPLFTPTAQAGGMNFQFLTEFPRDLVASSNEAKFAYFTLCLV